MQMELANWHPLIRGPERGRSIIMSHPVGSQGLAVCTILDCHLLSLGFRRGYANGPGLTARRSKSCPLRHLHWVTRIRLWPVYGQSSGLTRFSRALGLPRNINVDRSGEHMFTLFPNSALGIRRTK